MSSLLKPIAVDKTIFGLATAVLLFVCTPMIFYPEQSSIIVADIYNWVTTNFGFVYLWVVIGCVIFLSWLAFSKHGSIVLGDEGEKPEFSTFSWIAMLFSAGVGAGLIYWSGIEWASYYTSPPMGIEPRTAKAAEWAGSYGLFHWGIGAWCIYALPTVAIAYPFYVKKVPHLTLSTSCHALIGNNHNGKIARFMDLAFILAILGGAGTSLGLSTPLIAAIISDLFGFERGMGLNIAVLLICISVFSVSTYLGLNKGIRVLSDINMSLAAIFLIIVLFAGPTLFMINMGTNSIGLMFQNFIRMLTWTDPIDNTGFVKNWTVFYWAWWIAYGPFFGLFVTRISRGRSLKELILSMAFYGSLGGWIFYIIFGNYAMNLELTGALPVAEMALKDGPGTISAIITTLPFGEIALALFAVISIIFVATTYDSASYTIAAAASKEIHPSEDPSRSHRLIWAVLLGILPVALLMVDGIKAIQAATLLASVPIVFIYGAMAYSLYRSLKEDSA